jgi:IS5 family transposase
MMGKPKRMEPKLFYTGVNLADRIPQDHPLRRIKQMIPFDMVRRRVGGRYGYNGHESPAPTLILKLMFLFFYEDVRSERELMKHLRYRMDWLWFCDLDLDDPIPDHSVLSKARRRWGLDIFEAVFAEVLSLCVEAGVVDAKTVYADSTVLQADASVDSRIPRCLWEQMEKSLGESDEQDSQDDDPPNRRAAPPEDTQADDLPPAPQGNFNAHTVSRTDPDSATVGRRGQGVTLGYRDHSLVDDRHGVVVATVATAADYDDGAMLTTLLDKQDEYIGSKPVRVVGDSAYGTSKNIAMLRSEGIRPYLKRRPGRNGVKNWLKALPVECDPSVALRLMRRRMHTAEGRFAEAHVRYNHKRCRWRRRWRVQIQCYLVATVQNIGKLVRHGRWPSPAVSRTVSVLPLIHGLGVRFCTIFRRLVREISRSWGIGHPPARTAYLCSR